MDITAIIPFARWIGFVIPINVATRCSSDIIKRGRALIQWLGINRMIINEAIARGYGLSSASAALVTGLWKEFLHIADESQRVLFF